MKKLFVLLLLVVGVVSCTDPNSSNDFKVADMDPMAEGLASEPEYALFVEMLKMVDIYNALNLSSYSFTMFVASNEVVEKYIWYYNEEFGTDEVQYTSIYDLPESTVEILMKYHIINGVELKAADMYGKLAYANVTGDYLTVGINLDTGDRYVDNGEDKNASNIIVRDKAYLNGYAHEVDNMLQPITSTLWDLISANNDYTIFTEAIELCGLVDFYTRDEIEINGVTVDEDKTVFVVPNFAFESAGVTDIDDLVALFPSEDHTISTEPLHQWLLYHTMLDAIGYAELTNFPYFSVSKTTFPNQYHNLQTMAPLTMMSILDSANTIWLNPHDPDPTNCAQLDANNMDIPAQNGYLHEIDKMMNVPTYISPYYFIWDPFSSLEARAISVFRTPNSTSSAAITEELIQGQVDGLAWSSVPESVAEVFYYNSGHEKSLDALDGYFHGDAFMFYLGTNGYITFETPVLPAGSCQIFSIRAGLGTSIGGSFNCFWNDVQFRTGFGFNIAENSVSLAGPLGDSGSTTRSCGTTQKTHKLRWEPNSSNFGYGGFDVMIFKPI